MRQIYKPLLGLLTALLAHIPALAYDFYAPNADGKTIYYYITSDTNKTVAVINSGSISNSDYSDYSGAIVIPEKVNYNGTTYSVTSIHKYAFHHCSELTSVSIPNSVTSIFYDAFSYCTSLTSMTIPNSVTSIGDNAFKGCGGLTSVAIPSSVTTIGEQAFYYCTGLTSVHIDDIAAWCRIKFNDYLSNPLYYAQELYLNGSKVTNLEVPSTVTSIGEYAFSYCTSLTSVAIPNSVTEIGDYTFIGCDNLTSVHIDDLAAWCRIKFNQAVSNPLYYAHELYLNGSKITNLVIPNSVTTIGDLAFYGCTDFTSVIIGNSVTEIGSGAFGGCTSLKKVAKPQSLSYSFGSGVYIFNYNPSDCLIDDGLIFNASKSELQFVSANKEEVVIPNSVTTIGGRAFYNCASLTSVTIPNSVTEIGNETFYYCTSLTSVAIPSLVTEISSRAFESCTKLASVTIGNSVTKIGDYAFSNCANLSSVTIPNSVTEIGYRAFKNCNSLASVTIPNSVTEIGYYAFEECTSLSSVTIGNSVTEIKNHTFRDCTSLASATIGNSVATIGDYAFANCSNLASVTIPNSVTTIGSSAFIRCSSLISVIIGSSVTEIGSSVFDGCTSLKKVAKPQSLSYTFDSNPYTFSYNPTDCQIDDGLIFNADKTELQFVSNIKEVAIPNSVTTIGNYAFVNCTNLTSATIPSSVASIGQNAFENCSSLVSINIPNSVTEIGGSVFKGCTSLPIIDNVRYADTYLIEAVNKSLSSHSIKTGTRFIGPSAFNGCDGLVYVTIPNSVVSIGVYAFKGCTNLISATIPNSVTSIGQHAFSTCTKLASVTIGNSVTSIGNYAFNSCSALTSVTIPNSVTSIGQNAFSGCTKLASATIGNSVTTIGSYAFQACSALTSVTIPNSVTSIGYNAFDGCKSLVRYAQKSANAVSVAMKRTYSGVSGAAKACVNYDSYCEDEEITLDCRPNQEVTIYYGFKVNTQYVDIDKITLKSSYPYVYLKATALSPTTVKLEYSRDERGATFKEAVIAQVYGDVISEVSAISGDTTLTHLNPNTNYTYRYTVAIEEYGYTQAATATVTTPALELSTLPARVVNPGEVVVCAESNLDDAERNVGFEWRKVDAPSTVPSKEGAAVLYGGVMEGHIKGLSTSDYYNFRPYYESATGKRQYGEWMGFDPSDFSYFEPTLHTYAAAGVTHSSATMCGMAVPGTDGIAEQGFEYWPATAPSAAPAAGETSGGHATVKAEGLYMEAAVEGLLPETAYTYRSYIKTDNGATVYGEEVEFTTLADPQAGIGVVTADGVETEVTVEGYYDLNGRRHDEPRRGFNIVRYSDGSTRKLMVR